MPRVLEGKRHAVTERDRRAVRDILPERRGRAHVLFLVNRKHAIVPRLFGENADAVLERGERNLTRPRRRIDDACKSVSDQLRDAPDVVEVRVRDDESVHGRGVVRKRVTVLCLAEPASLREAAVDEDAERPLRTGDGEEKIRASHLASAAVKTNGRSCVRSIAHERSRPRA